VASADAAARVPDRLIPVPAPRSLPVVASVAVPTATYAMAQQAPVPLAVPQSRVLVRLLLLLCSTCLALIVTLFRRLRTDGGMLRVLSFSLALLLTAASSFSALYLFISLCRVPQAAATPLGVSSHLARKVRRLYVGNLPIHPGVTEQALLELFNALYLAAFGIVNLPSTGVDAVPAPATTPPVSSVWLHAEGKFSFIEMRTEQDAVNLIGLSGVSLHGRPLRINRPSDYHAAATGIVPPQPMPVDYVSLGRLCSQLGGIVQPPAQQHVAAAQAQLLQPMPAPAAVPVAPVTYPSSAPPTVPPPPPPPPVASPVTSQVAQAAHTYATDTSPATTAALPSSTSPLPPVSSAAVPADGPSVASDQPAADAVVAGVKTVVLLNMVTEEDVTGSSEDYDDLVDDIRAECSQYGEVTSVVIPRTPEEGYVKGVFVGFDRAEDASAAAGRLRGRAFDGRSIDVRFGLPGVSPETLATEFQP